MRRRPPPIHKRMPVILGDEVAWDAWLDPEAPAGELEELLGPFPAEEMHAYPVGT